MTLLRAITVGELDRAELADDFGFTVYDDGGPDGVIDFGDFDALLGLIGPCP